MVIDRALGDVNGVFAHAEIGTLCKALESSERCRWGADEAKAE